MRDKNSRGGLRRGRPPSNPRASPVRCTSKHALTQPHRLDLLNPPDPYTSLDWVPGLRSLTTDDLSAQSLPGESKPTEQNESRPLGTPCRHIPFSVPPSTWAPDAIHPAPWRLPEERPVTSAPRPLRGSLPMRPHALPSCSGKERKTNKQKNPGRRVCDRESAGHRAGERRGHPARALLPLAGPAPKPRTRRGRHSRGLGSAAGTLGDTAAEKARRTRARGCRMARHTSAAAAMAARTGRRKGHTPPGERALARASGPAP